MEKKIIGLLEQSMEDSLLVEMKFLDEKKHEIKLYKGIESVRLCNICASSILLIFAQTSIQQNGRHMRQYVVFPKGS